MTKNLDDFIAARRDVPFEYFRHDCAHIAADWIIACTGNDPLADLRAADAPLGRKSLLAAMRAVRAAGGFLSAANERLGPSLPGAMAQRGDVVLARSGGKVGRVSGYSFGICTGAHIAAPAVDRLAFLPISKGVATWRI
ncbi:DUF6950 family protein [Variovorax atrisoli]|uniref:DUF6950 family protein n=1 Tax=Variovorax atrisoli TaxID=3394203 RepID=UPI00339325BF